MFGAGLQLQQVTPGVQNVGSANLSGVMIAGARFGNNNPNSNSFFGDGTNVTTISNAVLVGVNASARSYSFGANGAVAVGSGAICGSGAGVGNACVAVGWNAKCNSASGTSGGNINIGGGSNCTDDGTGSNINLGYNSNTLASSKCVHINPGSDAAAVNGRKKVICIGAGAAARVNGNDQIVIGDANAVTVWIGPYRIGQSTGSTIKMADADHVMTSTEGVVGWSSITAARTNTLPLAASVPGGYIVRVGDFSGSASGVNTITSVPSGADTIVGPGSSTITTAYGWSRYMSDGISKWICNNNL